MKKRVINISLIIVLLGVVASDKSFHSVLLGMQNIRIEKTAGPADRARVFSVAEGSALTAASNDAVNPLSGQVTLLRTSRDSESVVDINRFSLRYGFALFTLAFGILIATRKVGRKQENEA